MLASGGDRDHGRTSGSRRLGPVTASRAGSDNHGSRHGSTPGGGDLSLAWSSDGDFRSLSIAGGASRRRGRGRSNSSLARSAGGRRRRGSNSRGLARSGGRRRGSHGGSLAGSGGSGLALAVVDDVGVGGGGGQDGEDGDTHRE